MKKVFNKKILFLMFIFAAMFMFSGCSLFSETSPDIKPHLISSFEKEENPVRPINGNQVPILGFSSESSDSLEIQLNELIEIIVKHKSRPVFTIGQLDEKVQQCYNEAIAVLDRYILNSYSDFEKIHAIHDYLTYYIAYDEELYIEYQRGKAVEDRDSFNLTGVFLKKQAVCDGFAKAFSLLCGIEGIPVMEVTGEFDYGNGRIPHKWNKAEIDGKWYNIDTTLDSYTFVSNKGGEISTIHHGYFLISDSAITSLIGGHYFSDRGIDALNNYEFHKNCDLFIIKNKQYTMEVNSLEELKAVFTYIYESGKKIGKVELKLNLGIENPDSMPSVYSDEILTAYKIVKNKSFVYNPDTKSEPFARFPNGVFLFLIYK